LLTLRDFLRGCGEQGALEEGRSGRLLDTGAESGEGEEVETTRVEDVGEKESGCRKAGDFLG